MSFDLCSDVLYNYRTKKKLSSSGLIDQLPYTHFFFVFFYSATTHLIVDSQPCVKRTPINFLTTNVPIK